MPDGVRGSQYVVITPARDEEGHIQRLLDSMAAQNVPPRQWVIVDDGSTDRTAALVRDYARRIPLVRILCLADRGSRVYGRGVVHAFNEGLRVASLDGCEFIVKLDADLAFGPDYFERLLGEFRKRAKLGIAGGHLYQERDGRLRMERDPGDHVRGATKIYRRACFEAIGGIKEVLGWDTIDELTAEMCGWTVQSFTEPKAVHLRPVGAVGGLLRGKRRRGRCCHYLGYDPLYMFAVAGRHLALPPYVTGGLAVAFGFVEGYARGLDRHEDASFRAFLRRRQRRRLMFWRRPPEALQAYSSQGGGAT